MFALVGMLFVFLILVLLAGVQQPWCLAYTVSDFPDPSWDNFSTLCQHSYYDEVTFVCDPDTKFSRYAAQQLAKTLFQRGSPFDQKCSDNKYKVAVALARQFSITTRPHNSRMDASDCMDFASSSIAWNNLNLFRRNFDDFTEALRQKWYQVDLRKQWKTPPCDVDLFVTCASSFCLNNIPFFLPYPGNFSAGTVPLVGIATSTDLQSVAKSINLEKFWNKSTRALTCADVIGPLLQEFYSKLIENYGYQDEEIPQQTIPLWACVAFSLCIFISIVCFCIGNCISTRGNYFQRAASNTAKSYRRWGAGFGGGMFEAGTARGPTSSGSSQKVRNITMFRTTVRQTSRVGGRNAGGGRAVRYV